MHSEILMGWASSAMGGSPSRYREPCHLESLQGRRWNSPTTAKQPKMSSQSRGQSPAQGPPPATFPGAFWGPWLSAVGWEVSPLWEGHGLGCAGACGGAKAANLAP